MTYWRITRHHYTILVTLGFAFSLLLFAGLCAVDCDGDSGAFCWQESVSQETWEWADRHKQELELCWQEACLL